MLTADQFWSHIRSLDGRELKTLARGHPFDVVDVYRDRVVLSPAVSGKQRIVPRDTLEGAFHALVQRRELAMVEIATEFSNFNGVYVAALLAALPDVAACAHPVRLIFMGHQLFYLE